MKTHVHWIAGAVTLAGLLVASCSTTGKVEQSTFGFQTPLFSVTGEIEGAEWHSGRPEGLDEDECLEITFWKGMPGAEGSEQLASTTTQTAASGTVPPGATHWQAAKRKCPGQELLAGGELEPVAARAHEFGFVGGSIPAAPGAGGATGTTYSLVVRAVSAAQAQAIVGSVLAAGLASPPDARVDVLEWSTTELVGEHLQVLQVNDDPFGAFELALNDAPYVDLGDVAEIAVDGWNVLAFGIPVAELFTGDLSGVHGVEFELQVKAGGATCASSCGLVLVPE